MKKLELVENASEWKRWWSMRWIIASAFFSAVVVAYATLPSDWLPVIPLAVKQWCSVGALISAGGAAVSRVIKQPVKE
jgi:hypothetical protein